jgi:uncharacterized protein
MPALMVEVVYAPKGKPSVQIKVEAMLGDTVAKVIDRSGITKQYPEISSLPVGIFSKQVELEQLVKDGDRIEIYRPLLIDPKEKRRQRANQKQ